MASEEESQFNLKSLFVPFTTSKAIYLIIIIGILVFGNILFNGFIWEDTSLIIQNPAGHSFNIFSPQNTFNYEGSGQFRPVSALVSAVLYFIFRENTFFYHLFSLSVHIANTILLFLIFKHFLQKRVAFFSSLLFLVHPMQTGSVTYFASFANLLFFFFGSVAVLLCVEKKIDYRRFGFILIFLFLSYFSKESGSLFFLIVTVYLILFKRNAWKYIGILTSISVMLVISRIVMGAGISNLILVPIGHLSFIERLYNIPAIFLYYIQTFFFPIQLIINQQWVIESVSFYSFYLPLIILCLFFFVLFIFGKYLLKKQKNIFSVFIFFVVWFLLGIGMHLQLMPLNMTVADHWFYFPIVGLIGMISVFVQELLHHKSRFSKVILISTIVILLLFSLRTMVRNTNYADDMTLFSHDSKIHTNAQTELMLGHAYLSQKRYADAQIHFKKSMDMHPYHLNTYLVGHTHELLDDRSNAENYYNKVIAYPNNKQFDIVVQFSYENIASMHTLSKKWSKKDREKTVVYINKALQVYPDSAPLWGNLAINEYELGHQEAALRAAKKAKELEPSPPTEYIYNQILQDKPFTFEK